MRLTFFLGGALPYINGYQVPVNRFPYFMPTLHPLTPFSLVHTQWPPFSTFVSNLTYNLQIFALFVRILKNLQILR